MPRTISDALNNHFQGGALTIATCVRVSRKDGVVLGFTSVDTPLLIEGTTYEPTGSINSSAIKANAGTGVDNMEILGLLTSDKITETDIIAGRYDRAQILIFQCNWNDLTQGYVILGKGRFGEVTIKDGSYFAEVRMLTQELKQYITSLTAPLCRVRVFGDNQCKFDVSTLLTAATVTSVSLDMKTIYFNGVTTADDKYDYGLLTFTTGPNIGLTREVKYSELNGGNQKLVMREAFPFDVLIGHEAVLTEGCDRTFPRCDALGNTDNFHAEPFIPGNDKVIIIGRPPHGN